MGPGGGTGSGGHDAAASRRRFLGAALLAGGGAALAACGSGTTASTSTAAPGVGGQVGLPPNRRAPVGSDQVPQIGHVVVVMMENHSFDNLLGTLGRGDGFALDTSGRPTATNPDGHGRRVRAFHMPTTCQEDGHPSNSWNASHAAYDGGTNQGFVTSASGPVAMGYWTAADLPFTAGLARTFPLADRWFSSTLCQTYPNRRFLMAGTSLGLVDDTFPSQLPPNGTIFDQFNRYDVSWRNYYSSLPTLGIFLPLLSRTSMSANLAHIDTFYPDCAAGTLPEFSLVDPDFGTQSQEDPQDIRPGDAFLSRVVHAVMSGPAWSSTLLVWTYDEGGGYYDHVPPPVAPVPDGVAPILKPGDLPGSFGRYGFRVPAGLVSPYARPGHVSHTVYDHTSVLKLVETKWNLPALTRRDAAANDLLDMVDLHGSPAFARPPVLPAPASGGTGVTCHVDPSTIPPPGAVVGSN